MVYENEYRTHECGQLRESDIGKSVRLSGWVENIRDHGGILFIDLRDETGVTQIVIKDEKMLENVTRESTVKIAGEVLRRSEETYNPKIETGTVEVKAESLEILGRAKANLPFEVVSSKETREDVRLSYRFLDLRNKKVHNNIIFRSKVISFLREKMTSLGFLDIQTPILSASSPEGARDYLIPSRKHKGKFYALPQAPQIFKQLLMVSGFDKYFQVAPCFRDEDARSDRTPGEFYQLDLEMAFATQEDVFKVAHELLYSTFAKFSDKPVSKEFLKIPYETAMLKYGTDKPDLRNPLEIIELSDMFVETDFAPFRGKTVRGINAPCGKQSKGFFEKMLKFATDEVGMKGLGYITVLEDGSYKGPIDKFLTPEQREELRRRADLKTDDVLYFIADTKQNAPKFAGQIREELGIRLGLLKDTFEICCIIDFPMYEENDDGKIIFTHNPFSMPQGGLDALNGDPLKVLAYQYDIVCNGVELVSGAVRNHDTEIMKKAFEIAGYSEDDLKAKFSSLYRAFQYGAPPHAGMALGIDRTLMLLRDEDNIREVIAFPMNSNAQDVLMGAPNEVTEHQLREVHIKLR